MPRRQSFDAASLYVHFQPRMVAAYPVLDGVPRAMQELLAQLSRPLDLSISARLAGLKRLLDDEARQVEGART